ncbi:ArsR/SmtB family transcription factor [Leifsonia poae]|uniref:ArsR/SmtB family transcription factor n=1 Tax=Leifsonia poae TaxID=110933 RepID=UPI001CC147B0|nr:metalloregulator ArsR/SmtB family transcription factor [Leifsonia poae]
MTADAALDQALRALADTNRRAILAVVRTAPRPVGEIAGELGLSQQVTSHHLRVLRSAGLVAETRAGTRHLFAVDSDGFAAARAYLDDFWPAKLSALRDAVEAGKRGTDG